MPKLRVNTEGLNLRRTPQIKQDNIIAVLPLAQEVDVLEEPAPPRQRIRSRRSQSTQGFVEITTNVDGELLRGFVKASLLRTPASTLKEALIHEAVQQWIRFDRGNGLEHEVPFFRFVGEFWQRSARISMGGIGISLGQPLSYRLSSGMRSTPDSDLLPLMRSISATQSANAKTTTGAPPSHCSV